MFFWSGRHSHPYKSISASGYMKEPPKLLIIKRICLNTSSWGGSTHTLDRNKDTSMYTKYIWNAWKMRILKKKKKIKNNLTLISSLEATSHFHKYIFLAHNNNHIFILPPSASPGTENAATKDSVLRTRKRLPRKWFLIRVVILMELCRDVILTVLLSVRVQKRVLLLRNYYC